MSNFQDLKKRAANFSNFQEDVKKTNAKTDYNDNDETFWSPARGKDGNGFAVIRFLPPPAVDGADGNPFVSYYRHSFQGPVTGDWYIENCRTTLGKTFKDPVNDLTRLLYKTERPDDKELANLYKRKQTHVSNILVIKDDLNPANNGKVKKWRYGKKIWEKIQEAINPKFGSPIDPFDFWAGANFGVITTTVGDWANYDGSKFDSPSPLSMDDAYLEELWRQSYSLKDFIDPKNFKDYDTLKERLDSVVGFSYAERGSLATGSANEGASQQQAPLMRQVAPSQATVAATPSHTFNTAGTFSGATVPADDDEELAFLNSLKAKAA